MSSWARPGNVLFGNLYSFPLYLAAGYLSLIFSFLCREEEKRVCRASRCVTSGRDGLTALE